MPQPLKRWLPEIDFTTAALAQRPDLAVRIAQVSAAWAEIQVSLGHLLAIILHTEAGTGVSMYLALTGSAAQEHVLSAAAETKLPKGFKSEFATLLKMVRARSKERNDIVHGLWSVHPKKADALINCPPDNLVRDTVNAFEEFLILGWVRPPSEDFVRNLMVYKAKDFTDILDRLYAARDQLRTFGLRVSEAHRKQLTLADALKRQPATAEASIPPDKSQTNPKESE